MCAGLQCVEIE